MSKGVARWALVTLTGVAFTGTLLLPGGQGTQITSATESPWYGIRRVPMEDMQTVAHNLGGTVVELTVRSETADQINAMLDGIEALGYQAVLNMYTRTTETKRPWDWNGSQWVFPQSAIETLQGVAHHPALLAIYALHEPLDQGGSYVPVEQQRELYQLLKGYTDGLPVFTDIASLSVWEDRGVDLTDGICDYCCTFPCHFRSDWTSEACLAETLRRIDADLDTQQRLMPNSQLVFLINTYSCPGCTHPFRLPTLDELVTVRDHMCGLDQPMMYYPWTHGTYDLTLEHASQLWPAVAEGCPRSPPDLSGSGKAVNQTETQVGDTLVYTLTVDNDGETATVFLVTDTLDANTAFAGFLETWPGSYSHAAGIVTWTGVLNGVSHTRLRFLATVGAGASGAVTNTACFDDTSGGVYTDTVTTSIAAPELRATKQVTPIRPVFVGTGLTYTIVISTTRGDVAQVSLSDTIPAHVGYVDSSARVFPPPPAHNPPQYVGQSVIWSGGVAPDEAVTVTFNVEVESDAAVGTVIDNVVWVDDPSDPAPAAAYRAFSVVTGYKCHLPALLRDQ
jgi:uncharacterized repeat protein (TIGR01451 family)